MMDIMAIRTLKTPTSIFTKVLFEFLKFLNNPYLNSNSHISKAHDYNNFFVIGFFTKQERRRFDDIIEQIKMNHVDWMKLQIQEESFRKISFKS